MSEPLWDPDVLSRIRRLQLIATQTVDGHLHGSHRSRRVGQNIEFADYKEYAPGDPLKHLDWRVMGRSDRLVVKRYEVETELACTVVLDVSADLGTGHGGPYGLPPLEGSKFGYAICMAATLVWFLHRHQEPVGLAVVGGSDTAWIPPRSGRSHISRLFATLAELRPSGRAGLSEALARIGPRLPRRSLVAIVSDFMEEPDQWVPSLRAMGRRRTDIVAFHILDRKEMRLDFDRPARFYSPEDDRELAIDPAGVRQEFEEVRDQWLSEVKGGLRRHRGRYYRCWTDEALARPLQRMIRGVPA